jgi:hypothetical protein
MFGRAVYAARHPDAKRTSRSEEIARRMNKKEKSWGCATFPVYSGIIPGLITDSN